MKNNLTTTKSTDLILKKSKSMLNITNRILSGKTALSQIDESWIERLWAWADENGISSDIIPREVTQLLKLDKINLYGLGLSSIPKELTQLKNLTFLDLSDNNLIKIPSNIGELKNLTFFSIAMNNLSKLPNSITKLEKLDNFWINRNNLILSEEQKLWIKKLTENGSYIY